MQRNQTIIPFYSTSRKRHNDAFNPQGRCWKAKHKVHSGEVVKIRPRKQSYPVKFITDELLGELVVYPVKCKTA